MMKEFQAENNQHQTTNENHTTSLTDESTENINLSSNPNDQSKISSISKLNQQQQSSSNASNHLKINTNVINSHNNVDKNKFNIKATDRSTSDAAKVIFNNRCRISSLILFRYQEVRYTT